MENYPFRKGALSYLIRGIRSAITEKTKRYRIGVLVGLVVTAFIASLMPLKLSPLETLEEKLLDYRFKIRGTIKPPDTVVIAAIDEKSIEKLGRWPWSRDKIAALVNKLNDAGAEIIAFDIIFSEKEKNDPLLGKVIDNAGNVILPVVFDFEKDSDLPESDFLLRSAFTAIINHEMFDKYNPIMAKRVLIPVSDIIQNAMGLGHINIFPDSDGTLRWESLIIGYKGYLYPSITLQTAAFYSGIPREMVVIKATEGIQLGKRYIPTDRWGRTLVNYYGANQTFRYISISDILEGNMRTELLQGKIVLIGATAVGIYDLKVTPFSPVMPGVEECANVISSILESRFIRCASLSTNLIVLLLSGCLLSILVARFKAGGASTITGIFLIVVLLSGYYLFAKGGLWINITYPSLNMLFIFIIVTSYNYALEERHARRIRAMFSSYVTKKIVDELIKNPSMAKLGGARREITLLFSDLKGFTSFSEKRSPEEVVSILNEYLAEMTEIIFKWEGTLDKFIGDAILAFWGAPMKQENHAELAVKCALNMTKRLEELQQKWLSEGKPFLDCGIGINTGEVVVGNIGAEGKKMDYTVIGDHVNLGSRVEGLTRQYDAHVLITEFTLDKIRGLITTGKVAHASTKGIANVVVKGKEKPVEVYEIKSLDHGVESAITALEEKGAVVLKEK